MSKKYTGKELAVKREIDRINRQIRQAFTKLGADSRLAQQYETLLYGGEKKKTESISDMRGKGFQGVRYTKEGIPQISASAGAIWEFANITSFQKQLQILGKQQTVKQAQQAMIAAYETRTGEKVSGRGAIKYAIEEEKKRYSTNEKIFHAQLEKLYKIEKKRGVKLKATDDLKQISKGRWTSEGELAAMIRIVNDAIRADEEDNIEIIRDKFGENQW